MQKIFVNIDCELRDRLRQLLTSADLDHSKVRNTYRQYNLLAVRKWILLNNNYRSAILLVACLAGSPLYYFVAEFTLWNGLLIWVQANQATTNEKLKKELDDLGLRII